MNAQEEIVEYRKHMRATPPGAGFFLGMERDEYEQEVIQALAVAVPRLYALNFDDEVDVPPEIHAAVEVLERDLGMYIEREGDHL